MRTYLLSCGAVLAVTGLSLSPGAAAAESRPSRKTGDLAIQARAILQQYCGTCHTDGPGKKGRLTALDHASVTGSVPVSFANQTLGDRSQILEFLTDGSMPPAGKPRPSKEQIELLRQWIAADTPAYPRAFDERTVRQWIREDIKALDATHPVAAMRYVSLAHLVEAPQKVSLASAEQSLRKAFVAATRRPALNMLEPIDPTATVFRFDLRPVGWDKKDLFQKVEQGKGEGAASIVPYDLLLLEYPFQTTPHPDDKDQLEKEFFAPTRQFRPNLFLRGDWLAESLKEGTPLADDMLAMTELALAESGKQISGPTPRYFDGAKALVTAAPSDGTAVQPPVGAVYLGDISPEPKPFGLTADVRTASLTKIFKLGLKLEKAEGQNATEAVFHVFRFPTTGDIRWIEIDNGDRLSVGKQRLAAPKRTDMNDDAGFAAPPEGGKEFLLVVASKSKLPQPTIVRSEHSENRVWRFYYDDPSFDGRDVVRKLVPILPGEQPRK